MQIRTQVSNVLSDLLLCGYVSKGCGQASCLAVGRGLPPKSHLHYHFTGVIKLAVTYKRQPDWQQECRNMEISTHLQCVGLELGLELPGLRLDSRLSIPVG